MRLIKYVQTYANLTRKTTINLYENNLIKVNNEIKSLSYEVDDNDVITLDNKIIDKIPNVYFLYNKPIGVLSDINNLPSSYINHIGINYKLMPVGRLDKNSRGLMILTNDGKYINKLLDPIHHVEKEYLVYVKNIITDDFIKRLNNIKSIDDKELKPFKIIKNDNLSFRIILTEGKYHQIRKMVKLALNEVVDLIRIRIGNYTIDGLKEGELKEIADA